MTTNKRKSATFDPTPAPHLEAIALAEAKFGNVKGLHAIPGAGMAGDVPLLQAE
jgi:hypothetical protein